MIKLIFISHETMNMSAEVKDSVFIQIMLWFTFALYKEIEMK